MSGKVRGLNVRTPAPATKLGSPNPTHARLWPCVFPKILLISLIILSCAPVRTRSGVGWGGRGWGGGGGLIASGGLFSKVLVFVGLLWFGVKIGVYV